MNSIDFVVVIVFILDFVILVVVFVVSVVRLGNCNILNRDKAPIK